MTVARRTIPLLRVAGSHREVGRAVGAATAAVLREAVDFDAALPAGRSRAEQLALAECYRVATLAASPWLVAEIDGAAEGAAVDRLALFAASIEEIWTVRPSQVGVGGMARMRPVEGRCTDLVAVPPASADGHAWVAHNNDLSVSSEAHVVAVEWRVPGEPVVFSLGIGPWISVGWNDAGLSLTGNELAPNDERVGVPRLLMVREQLTARTVDEAVTMALRPDRASSYNTVFVDRAGRVADVEGSATDAEVIGATDRGTLAHTNHYVCARMLGYEGDPVYARSSNVRYRRAVALLDEATGTDPGSAGTVTPEALRAMLADHATEPSLCRHPRPDGGEADSVTVFWSVADVSAGEIRYGLGRPCEPGEERYGFV